MRLLGIFNMLVASDALKFQPIAFMLSRGFDSWCRSVVGKLSYRLAACF